MSDHMNAMMERVKRIEKIHTAVQAFRAMHNKYDPPPEDNPDTPAKGDPKLTINDMGEKINTWKKLEVNILPSIKEQLTSLATSLDLLDLEEHPNPNPELTLEILSKLDESLESAVFLTKSFALESPVPDEKHDHHLEKSKLFRSSQLKANIKALIYTRIRRLLQCCQEFLGLCNLSIAVGDDPAAQQEASRSRQLINLYIFRAGDLIDKTIRWSRKSDWAIIHDDWLLVAGTFTQALEDLTTLANPMIDSPPELASLTINPTEEHDQIGLTNTRRARNDAMRKRLIEVIVSIMSLVKLARILVKKLSRMVPRKPIYELDTEMNSETIRRLRDAFDPMTPTFEVLGWDLQDIYMFNRLIAVTDLDSLHASVEKLLEAISKTLTGLDSNFFTSLYGAEHAPTKNDFLTWSLTLKELWETTAGRSLDLISSLKHELDQELGPEH
ncbi:hypothetical protein MJO29_006320 [Puccinia striiformis f. sp. tritici]|uniref:Uncharacterized protein n=2 Tax=Puccinia striiformis TaxID=27350 RepID=A0A2S4V773_9BASI|nr:hypothetical protein MJO29_006320 [Puccinia striiformis f. sp. tritici]KAI9609199.1 hypothetical protein KEM48_002905 [Puccinia striiformis f. sp. tritici PST-130]POW05348.1 hypothetical protein PSHT_10827 [Puccinia striiformis]